MARRYDRFEYSGGTCRRARRVVKEPRHIYLKPFKARRAYIVVQGVRVRADVMPYTYATTWMYRRNSTPEYGAGIYLQECERGLYRFDGVVYKHVRKMNESGEWRSEYVRYSGGAYGRRGTGLNPIEIIDGIISA